VPHLKLVIGYDGTDFFGSQAQTGRRTVQSELERALEEIGSGARLAFAGRTDRGVHAVGQVASGAVGWNGTLAKLRSALNAVGPDDLLVSSVEAAEPGFHARYSAKWREYRYRLVVADVEPVLTRRSTWWRRDDLQYEAASDACQRLLGKHQFGSFASGGKSQELADEQLERTILACEWREIAENLSPIGLYRELRIVADGFLPQMVRNITGAVIEVASGNRDATWIEDLLEANDRRAMGEGAPAHGLVLWQVGYSEFGSGCQAD
jgi:tRNA pseudouridine38-40 synthase